MPCQRCDRPAPEEASAETTQRLRDWDRLTQADPDGAWHSIAVDNGTPMALCPVCFIEICNWLGIYPEPPAGMKDLFDADKAKTA